MPGIAGLRQGLSFVEQMGTGEILAREIELMKRMVSLIEKLPCVEPFVSEEPGVQTGVLSFRIAGEDPELTAEKLSKHGIAVRAGLHCAPLAHDTAGSSGTVRLSFSVFNTDYEVRRFASVLQENLE